MAQYNTLNVKLSNSQLNKLKSAIKNRTEVTLNLSSNLNRNSNDETNFSYKLLLTDTQVSKICKAFAKGSSANIKCSKTQLSKIQSGELNILDMMNLAEVVYKIANKANDLSNKVSLDDVIEIADVCRNFYKILKKHEFGTGITLTNNEIKDIIKVIKPLEKWRNFIKRNY